MMGFVMIVIGKWSKAVVFALYLYKALMEGDKVMRNPQSPPPLGKSYVSDSVGHVSGSNLELLNLVKCILVLFPIKL